MTLDADAHLVALALIQNRLGNPTQSAQADFVGLFTALTAQEQFNVVQALAALAAMILEDIQGLAEAVAAIEDPEELPIMVLDCLRDMILNEAVRER